MQNSSDLRRGRRYISCSGVSLLSSELKNEYNSSFEISLFCGTQTKKERGVRKKLNKDSTYVQNNNNNEVWIKVNFAHLYVSGVSLQDRQAQHQKEELLAEGALLHDAQKTKNRCAAAHLSGGWGGKKSEVLRDRRCFLWDRQVLLRSSDMPPCHTPRTHTRARALSPLPHPSDCVGVTRATMDKRR